MKNKISIQIVIAALIVSILFLGATITGLVIQKVEYQDLCHENEDCFGDDQCCIIYGEINLGICMEQCQSLEFLCQSDAECEEGTVCCRSQGRKYGICNVKEKCINVDIFADYIGKISFVEPGMIIPITQQPGIISNKEIIIGQTLIIIALLAVVLRMMFGKGKS